MTPIDFSSHEVTDLDIRGEGAFELACTTVRNVVRTIADPCSGKLPDGISLSFDRDHIQIVFAGPRALRAHMPMMARMKGQGRDAVLRHAVLSISSAMGRAEEVLCDPHRQERSDELMARARRGVAVAARLSKANSWMQTSLPSAFGPAELSDGSSFKNVAPEHLSVLQTLPASLSVAIDLNIEFSMGIGPCWSPVVLPNEIDDVDVLRAISEGRV